MRVHLIMKTILKTLVLVLVLAVSFLFTGHLQAKSLEAQWSPHSVTISFNANGGSGTVPEPQTYTYGVSGTLPGQGSLSRTGYTFGGWTTTSTSKTAVANTSSTNFGFEGNAKTLYAIWTPMSYSISYSLGGGSASNPSSYTIETDSFTLNNPSRSGYTFTGWSGTGLSGSSNKSVTINKGSTGTRSYTANWSQNIMPVTLDVTFGYDTISKVHAYKPDGSYTEYTSNSITCYPGCKVVLYGNSSVEWRYNNSAGAVSYLGQSIAVHTTVPSYAYEGSALLVSYIRDGYVLLWFNLSSGWVQDCSFTTGT